MTWIAPASLTPDNTYSMNGVTINKYLLKDHNVNQVGLPSKRTHKFKGVVIHNTDRVGATDEGRQYTAATLNNNVASRTTFYVTELSAWQNLDLDDMNWTCADGTTGDGNNGCISLEIIMKSKNQDIDLKARDNGARIAAYILWQNNMTVDDMYTHNYFLNVRDKKQGSYYSLCTTPTPTRNCPYYIVWDWEGFRKQVDNYIVKLGGKSIYSNTSSPTLSGKCVKYIYQATSTAAIRSATNKSGTIYGRVTKGSYYPADMLYDNTWFRHTGTNSYSMLNDGGALFTKVGEYTVKTTTTKINVRTAPTTKSDKVTVLNTGTKVYVWDGSAVRNDGYTWYKIIISNKVGYVAGEYLK